MEIAEEKKLNIGLFIDTWYPMIDGVISVVDNYAKRLCKIANVTVFTVAARNKKYVDDKPYNVVRCQRLVLPGLDYDLGMPTLDSVFMKELKNSKLDIVHIHSPFSVGKVGLQYAKRHKIPCVATNHSQFKQDFYKATKSNMITDMLLASVMKVFNGCDENWSVNEMTKQLFIEYGLKKPPYVMPNATDFKHSEYDDFDIDINQKFKIKPTEKVLMFVGRMNALKNIPFLIDAFNLIVSRNKDFKLILVGDGTELGSYKNKVKKLRIENNVIFAGKVSDKKLLGSMYKRADLFVFPSFYDTDGIVKKEAAAFKTPSLTIEGSFASSGITDKVNGYVSKNTLEDFANKILNIFEDEKTYLTVCDNCLNDIYINWDDLTLKVMDRYNFLIKQKKLSNLAIKNKAKYSKTIKAIKEQKLKNKQKKSNNSAIKNKAKYSKTIKAIKEQRLKNKQNNAKNNKKYKKNIKY